MPKPTFAPKFAVGLAALFLATPPAWADLQARTVWQDWQEITTRFGGTLGSAGETYADGVLTLRGVNFATDLSGTVSVMTLGDIAMREQDDGSVVIELPSEMRGRTETRRAGVQVQQDVALRQTNLSVVAREDRAVRVYDIGAETVTVDIDTAIAETDETTAPQRVTFRLAGVGGLYRSGLGEDGQGFTQSYNLDELDMTSTFEESGDSLTASYALTDVTSALRGVFGTPPVGAVRGLSDMNITYDGTMDHAGSTLSVAGNTASGSLNIAGTSQGGTIAFDLGEETLSYAATSTGGTFTARVPNFPLPVTVSMDEVTTALTLPIGEPGTQKPFAAQVALRELSMDDTLWSLFDPTGQLPRDPATLVVDLEGAAVMNADLFGDPEAAARLTGAPGTLKELTITELLLNFAGAELRGDGDLDFPNDTAIPEPVGTINLALDGGFGLLDRIVALGFIPQQQAQFLKGMSGAVARSVGEDQLESVIEFTPGGGITANGLPLR